MQIYPAIDLKEGRCVRLLQGNYQTVSVYGENPLVMAKMWERQGARYLHIVDLDGAKEGKGVNDHIIGEIVRSLHIPVQVGGGIRSLEAIQNKLSKGVRRVILGSLMVKEPDLVKEALKLWGPERIVIGIDAKKGKVAIHGWQEMTDHNAVDLGRKLKEIGVQTIIYTDIAKDGMMQGPNVKEIQRMASETGLKVIASGGISKLQDIKAAETVGASGVIIGKALYTGAIALPQAIAFAKEEGNAK